MAKTLEQMFNDTMETSAKVGARVNSHVDYRTAQAMETSAKVGARVNSRIDRRAAEIKQTTAEVGKRVNAHSDANHAETRRIVSNESDDTRRTIREEGERTRYELSDRMEAPETFIGIILGILAGIAMWFCEKDVIIKPVTWDKVGNVTKYGPDTFLVVVLSVILAIFVFFVTTWIIHAIRRR